MYICRVDFELLMIEVRFSDFFVEVECEVVYGKFILIFWNVIVSRLFVSEIVFFLIF